MSCRSELRNSAGGGCLKMDDKIEKAAPSRFPALSVIIPVRGHEATLADALDSVLSQDYEGQVEVIVADGTDEPAVSETVSRSHPEVRIVPNPDRTIGYGIEAGLRAATGEVMVRCDAHTLLPPGYLRRVAETLERTSAACVGGRQKPVGATLFERALGIGITSWLGSGGARYRIGGPEGPSDTVYLGSYRVDALDAVGGYDPTFRKNQDYELNWRLRQHGETVWFDPQLEVIYRPRSTLRALAKQYFNYGRWKQVMLRRHPASVRARHLAAPAIVLALAAAAALALAGFPRLALIPSAGYILTIVGGAAVMGLRRRESAAVLLPVVLAAMHLSWGIGFFLPPGKTDSGQSRKKGPPGRRRTSLPKSTPPRSRSGRTFTRTCRSSRG